MLGTRLAPLLMIGTLVSSATWAYSVHAQELFYKGKTIGLTVGLAPGGGYDLYSRIIARQMGKHISGNPTIVVDNMTGAGSVIAANYMFKAAKPDGLTIGHILGGLFLQQLLENPAIEFDGRKFEYIGVPTQDHFLIGLSKATGITSFENWMASKKSVKLGGVTPGGATDDLPKVLAATLGLPIKVVTGYKDTGPIRLAFDSAEVDGVCNAWESFKSTWRKQVESGEVAIILQATVKGHPELSNIPVAFDFLKTEEARKLFQVVVRVHGPSTRPYFLPPGTPKERVQILRKAYMDTMKDPEFLADASRSGVEYPVTKLGSFSGTADDHVTRNIEWVKKQQGRPPHDVGSAQGAKPSGVSSSARSGKLRPFGEAAQSPLALPQLAAYGIAVLCAPWNARGAHRDSHTGDRQDV